MEEDNLLTLKVQLYIPKGVELRKILLDKLHKIPYSSHPSYEEMIKVARKQYIFPGMKKDVVEYIDICQNYHQFKAAHKDPTKLLHPFPISELE